MACPLLDSFVKGGKVMVRGDSTVKIYRRLGKKRYLEGKYIYRHERIYVPIPSKLHSKIKPFLNHRLKIDLTSQNGDLVITLHPVKRFGTPNNLDKNSVKKQSRTLILT
jgi:hypothetical protein